MLSLKENFFETMKNGKPDAFVNEWEVFPQVWEPITSYMIPVYPGSAPAKNPWGVLLKWEENEPGNMPIVTEETKVCPDITEWQKYVKAPDLEAMQFDWTQARADQEKFRAEGKLSMAWIFTGLFELLHYLMGFEDALVNLMTEPESVHELLDYLVEHKLQWIRVLHKELNPDVILFHDDWGAKDRMFMSPDIWREFFKDRYKKIYSYMKELNPNVIAVHHADSYCEPIAKDMVDVGIDIWEGVLPSNDIQKIKEVTDHKLILMGGIDAGIVDRADQSEEVIRAEVARACRDYHEGGCFIPCLTYGGEGSIYPGVNDLLMDEIRKQSKIYFK